MIYPPVPFEVGLFASSISRPEVSHESLCFLRRRFRKRDDTLIPATEPPSSPRRSLLIIAPRRCGSDPCCSTRICGRVLLGFPCSLSIQCRGRKGTMQSQHFMKCLDLRGKTCCDATRWWSAVQLSKRSSHICSGLLRSKPVPRSIVPRNR